MSNGRKHKNCRDAINAEKPSCDDGSAQIASQRFPCQTEAAHSELLILQDGRILVHNLTPAFADLLHELNPEETQIAGRTSQKPPRPSSLTPNELPN